MKDVRPAIPICLHRPIQYNHTQITGFSWTWDKNGCETKRHPRYTAPSF